MTVLRGVLEDFPSILLYNYAYIQIHKKTKSIIYFLQVYLRKTAIKFSKGLPTLLSFSASHTTQTIIGMQLPTLLFTYQFTTSCVNHKMSPFSQRVTLHNTTQHCHFNRYFNGIRLFPRQFAVICLTRVFK